MRKKPIDQSNTSLTDMTINLLENTVEESAWNQEAELLSLTHTLNRVLSKKKRNVHKLKSLRKIVDREKHEAEKNLHLFIQDKDKELQLLKEKVLAAEELLKETRAQNASLSQISGKSPEEIATRMRAKETKDLLSATEEEKTHLESMNVQLHNYLQKEEEKRQKTVENVENVEKQLEDCFEKIKTLEINRQQRIAELENINKDIAHFEKLYKEKESCPPRKEDKAKAMIAEARTKFQKEREKLATLIGEEMKDRAEEENRKTREKNKKLLAKVCDQMKKENQAYMEQKQNINALETEHWKAKTKIQELEKELADVERKKGELVRIFEGNESFLVNNRVKKIKKMLEYLGRVNSDRELELARLNSSTEKYKKCLAELTEKLEEEAYAESDF